MKVKIPYRMTNKERKAMNEEIEAQLAEARVRDSDEYDAAILWALHLCFGFGKKRLRRFYDFFRKLYLSNKRWQFGRNEVELLKGIGVDIEEWNREGSKD
jgi:asparagine synthetase B (glutamine-hydrolysing)